MEKKIIYLDHAATTATRPEVVDAMLPYFTENFWNPSSVYTPALNNRKVVDESRETIARSLGTTPENIYFTAGGSESDNWALKCTAEAYANKGKHIITSKIEHHAILHTAAYLEERGFEVTYLDVDEYGKVNPADVEAAIRPDTILISVMYANNEIGTIEPIKEIGEIAHKHGILFHTDAVQAFGQVPINVDECHIDMLSASGHKLNGPKGIGFLYIRKGVKIRSFVHGGAQERKRRAGTENVPGFAGFGLATKIVYEDLEARIVRMRAVKDRLTERLKTLPDVYINEGEAPHILSVSFVGVRSEVMLHALEEREIYVSSGSACSSNKPAVSHVLSSIGLQKNRLESTIRFSFSAENTVEQADYAADVIEEILPVYRKYVRKK